MTFVYGKFRNSDVKLSATFQNIHLLSRELLGGRLCVAGGAMRRVFGFVPDTKGSLSSFDIDIFVIGPPPTWAETKEINRTLRERLSMVFPGVDTMQKNSAGSLTEYWCYDQPKIALNVVAYGAKADMMPSRNAVARYQFIADRSFASWEALLRDFDFTMCAAVTNGDDWCAHSDFFRDNNELRLRMIDPRWASRNPSRYRWRLSKYAGKYGAMPSRETFRKTFFLDDTDRVAEQLMVNVANEARSNGNLSSW